MDQQTNAGGRKVAVPLRNPFMATQKPCRTHEVMPAHEIVQDLPTVEVV